jgi:selenocysteine-specific elongation factor
MKNHTIIGTAGHIDHGKTALIKALTGIDADRLKEEKERGITIDIGFAYWREDVTFIDVPGHEKLIRNMVAGVNTIDFFILVIAADDGIMPQTIEHLDILNFFRIHDGIIVINKIDLVDDEWYDLVLEEVKVLLGKYNLSHLPIIDVSALTGKNIDTLRNIIEEKIASQESKHSSQPFRLNIDRSFTIKGFGTVVTGTVLSGTIRKGDEVEMMPAAYKVKVRGIQTHTSDVDQATMGFRAAINLQGISKENIVRGDVLTTTNSMAPVHEFVGQIRAVSNVTLKVPNRSRIHTYIGTAERSGQMIWFDKKKFLEAGQTFHVRVKLDQPVSTVRNDTFLVRLHSPVITLAGGHILEINPAKISYKEHDWQDYFKTMSGEDLTRIIETIIQGRYFDPTSISILQQNLFDSESKINNHIQALLENKKIYPIDIKGKKTYIHASHFDALLNDIEIFIREFHISDPLKGGMNRQELISGLGKEWIANEIVESAIDKLLGENRIKYEHKLFALSDFDIKVSGDKDQILTNLLLRFKEDRFTPPNLEELAIEMRISLDEIKSLAKILSNQKKLLLINRQFYLHQHIWEELLTFIKSYFSQHPEMPVSALKEFIQTTRKYAIPLFEFLDSEGYTIREGDVRKKGSRL